MSKKSATLVTIQISCMVLLLILDTPIKEGCFLIFQIIGLIIGIWAVYTMKIGNFNIVPEVKSKYLVKNGPYKWVRNPMYTSVLIYYFPLIFNAFKWTKLIVFLILFITLLIKIFNEEKFLAIKFSEYNLYKSKTKRLIPFVF